MCRFAKTKVLHAWIALMAFLFGVLAPTVSHALSASLTRTQAAEICTSTGIKPVAGALAAEGKPAYDSVLHGFEHCKFCGTHAGSFALLPQSNVRAAVQHGHDLFPSLFYQSHAPLFAWALAKARAPPVASF